MVKKGFFKKDFNIFFLFVFFIPSPFISGLNTSSNTKKQVIVLKSDDFVLSDQWKRYVKYIEDKNIKACLGVVGKELYHEPLCEWIRSLSSKTNFEFWNHGLTHDCGEVHSEFEGRPYQDQSIHLQKTQQLFKDKFGITLHTFNAPCMEFDENTSRALADIEDIKIWFFGKKDFSKLCLPRKGNIEFPTGYPDYNKFIERYNQDRLEQYDHLALQVHPGWWDDKCWEEFEKIIDFLLQKEVVFMTAFEYYRSITTTVTVTDHDDGGPGSLRAAIDQANHNSLKPTVILLPAGTYYLSGLKGENNNTGGDLDIAADLTIQGDGADSTIIDGSRSDRVFHIRRGRVNISRVTLCHGRASSGAGIRVDGGIVTIGNCMITGNTVVDDDGREECGGGGIYVQKAKVTISGCTISGNTGNSADCTRGGGIYINRFNTRRRADIRNCLIEGNTANTNPSGTGLGGGIYLSAGNPAYEVTVYNNTIKNNIAAAGGQGQGEGGGLYLAEIGSANLERNRFIENAASANMNGNGRGGAIFAAGGTAFTITNNLLVNNNAGSAGGGIYLNGASNSGQIKAISCAMLHNTLANNDRESGRNGGEGIYVGDYVTADLVNNLITGHTKGIYKNDTTGTGTITADTNLFYNTGDPLVGSNALLREPLLNPDFKPMENSPVVDAGKTVKTVTRDLEGTLRPQEKGYDIGCYEYSAESEPLISLNRTVFNFAGSGTHVTGSQLFRISNIGTGILNWSIEPDKSWIRVSPSNDSGPGVAAITIDPAALIPGTHTGTLLVTALNALNSPQIVKVNLTIYPPGLTGSPFGRFTTPEDGTTGVSGTIAVTGWVLDDIQVDRVEIYCKQDSTPIYIGEAVFVEGTRPDVEQTHPNYPLNYKAGWGYMMLTYFLPNQGSGTFTLYAVAADREGNRVTLGTKTITCDNANAVTPFGAIDAPTLAGGPASGKIFPNWGWVLTPKPNRIPIDGSTIHVWVNGVNLGHPTYNVYRADIAGLFPGYLNSKGAVGYFYLDTTVYRNGIHIINWTAEDSAGSKGVIGSQYFLIRNIGGLYDSIDTANTVNFHPEKFALTLKSKNLNAVPVDHHTPLWIKKGYGENITPHKIYPGEKGIIHITIKELERIEIRFPFERSEVMGYRDVGGQPYPLPIGSTFDARAKIFYWQPGPGFVGDYRLNFIVKGQDGKMRRMDIIIKITTK